MRYFEVIYEWHTRPWYHKGRLKTEKVVFAANSLSEGLLLAKAEGERRYPRRRWRIDSWEEKMVK
jgi:hypothetical protein